MAQKSSLGAFMSTLEDTESGVESLFETIKNELPKHLKKIDDIRDVWSGRKEAKNKN